MSSGPGVDVVLPCLDEAAGLAWVLPRLPPGMRAIVVDNGSTDGSAELARSLGARVVPAPVRGYGAACQAGLEAAESPVVAVLDADASLDPQELPALVEPLVAGHWDLVVGRRRPAGRGAFPWRLRVANVVLAARVRRRTGLTLRDVGPVRVGWRTDLLGLGLTDRRSGYPVETVVRAADAGWRVGQVDVGYRPRRGRSKVTGTPLGFWRAVADMGAALDTPRPGRVAAPVPHHHRAGGAG